MQRKETWRVWSMVRAVGFWTLAFGAPAAVADTPKRPNVLIITTDQQRVDATSAAGNRWLKTPQMDSIATGGVYFTKSYCPYPLCSPSRSALHTSRMPHEIGVDRNSVPIDRDHLVSSLDVLPTICDYAGVQPPAVVRGQGLREAIDKPDRPGHQFVVSEMARGSPGGVRRSFMVRTAKYKYMVFPAGGGQRLEMLFDLQSDPNEMKDLAADPATAGELDRHRRLLARWNKTTEEDKHPVRPSPKKPRRRAKRKR